MLPDFRSACRLRGLPVFASLLVLLAAAPAQEFPPDLLRGGVRDEHHDWNLGPTGARGWIHAWRLSTAAARQILVTAVDAGSPAEGVLVPGDVIVGAQGRDFDRDARIAFARAITEAERTANEGRLRLRRFRDGRTEEVELRLPVLGDYAATAPAECEKSRRIFDRACDHLLKRGIGSGVLGSIEGLALLASGRADAVVAARAFARKLVRKAERLSLAEGMVAWEWGHANLFLAELFLVTRDEQLLPAIRSYSRALAEGQSGVGTWGHGMALPNEVRSLGGYGALNQAGLVCWLSLVLAQRAGVDDRVVRDAIARAQRFFAVYEGQGSVPYGDHPPYWDLHDNNGKNGLAAIGFGLLGEKRTAGFFARLSTAAYAERELGHTGNVFGFLWGPLGVAALGREAQAAHFAETAWFYDLGRRADGSFPYQGAPAEHDSTMDWDATAVFALTFAAPRKSLAITGRDGVLAEPLGADEVRETIEAGRGFDPRFPNEDQRSRSVDELLSALASWSPTVRFRAATALAKRKEDALPRLLVLLRTDDFAARAGACQALEFLGKRAVPAIDELARLLDDPDPRLCIRAAYALAGIGPPARRLAPKLLALAAADDPADPRQGLRRYLGLALFQRGYLDNGPKRGLLADGLDGVERGELLSVIRKLLRIDDGLARSALVSVLDRLGTADLEPLWPDLLRVVVEPAPSGEMFADGIRIHALELLARHRVKDGMRAALAYARNQNRWGSQDRMETILVSLSSYGSAAKEFLPELRALAESCRSEKDFPDDCKAKKTEAVERAIRVIEAATEAPPLRTVSSGPSSAPRTIKVFLLAGQSNMEGQAVVDLDGKDYNDGRGTLARLARDPAKAPVFAPLVGPNGAFVERTDVFVTYQPEDGPRKNGPLRFGYTPYGGRHHFGPELGIGFVLGDHFEERVLLVKTAWGGKSLYRDFRPPGAGGKRGPYYTKMLEQLRDVLARPAEQLAGYAGEKLELAGVVWFQGWNDLCDDQAIPEYEANLAHLVRDLRKDLGRKDLPFVIGELGNGGAEASPEMAAIRRAQAAVAARSEFAPSVRFVQTHDFQRPAEESPCPGHLHHEFANAETYWLTGLALGRGLVSLLPAPGARSEPR